LPTGNTAISASMILRSFDCRATAGGLVGGLVGLGIPEIEAKRYEERLKSGNYVIAVDADDHNEVDRAKTIFKNEDADDIATSSLSTPPSDERRR
jgi:hypothetical protein